MATTETKKPLGMKWYTYLTVVRPVLSATSVVPLIVNAINYAYWNIIPLICAVLGVIVAVMNVRLALLSGGDYDKFMSCAKKLYLLEVFYIPFNSAVAQFSLVGEIEQIIFTVLIGAVVLFFLWYKLNCGYLERRRPKSVAAPKTLGEKK